MATALPTDAQPTLTTAEVLGLLREIGYLLWLSRKLAAEIKEEAHQPVRPEMAEFCAVDMVTCAA